MTLSWAYAEGLPGWLQDTYDPRLGKEPLQYTGKTKIIINTSTRNIEREIPTHCNVGQRDQLMEIKDSYWVNDSMRVGWVITFMPQNGKPRVPVR